MSFSIRKYIDNTFFNSPTQEVGIGGFTLFARVAGSVDRKVSIPTTVLENGSVIADHLINQPIAITIDGNVSQIFSKPSPSIAALTDSLGGLGVITQYLPERTQAQISKVNGITADINAAVARADALLDNATKIAQGVGIIKAAAEAQDLRETFLNTIDAIITSKSLIPIDMPFRTYENMAIKSCTTTEDNKDGSIKFKITAEQIRFAEIQFVEVEVVEPVAKKPAPKVDGQDKSKVDKGVQEGEESEQSFLSYISSAITG